MVLLNLPHPRVEYVKQLSCNEIFKLFFDVSSVNTGDRCNSCSNMLTS